MSSPDPPPHRPLLAALALLAAFGLAGCFRPMYAAPAPGAVGLTQTLAAVDVPQVEGRPGLVVREKLLFAFTGGGAPLPPRYTLTLTVESTLSDAMVEAQTSLPQLQAILLSASFTLKDAKTNKVLLDGRNYARKTFDVTLQRFAALRAARDAENQAAGVLADQIRTQVAVYLSAHGG